MPRRKAETEEPAPKKKRGRPPKNPQPPQTRGAKRYAQRKARQLPKPRGHLPIGHPHRPKVYDPCFNERAKALALLGLTEEQIANHFGVDLRTFQKWKNEIPAFFRAVEDGKLPADGEIAVSLHQRAKGYDRTRVKYVPYGGKMRRVTETDHYPADVGAIKTWLFNRHRDLWKEGSRQIDLRAQVEIEMAQLSPDERYQRLAELLAKAGVIEFSDEPIEGEYEELPRDNSEAPEE